MLTPLLLSVRIAGLATLLALLLGVAAAALLARWRSPLSNLLDATVNLPLVLPPTVLGYYLLVLWGARSPLGEWFTRLGLPLVFTWRGAVLAAATIALPLVAQSSKAAFEAVDPALEDVARTLGRSELAVFFTVSLPLAWRGVLAGCTLAFARALGEFGATLMVAAPGHLSGRSGWRPGAGRPNGLVVDRHRRRAASGDAPPGQQLERRGQPWLSPPCSPILNCRCRALCSPCISKPAQSCWSYSAHPEPARA
jgi:molybdate transport system permease protein